MMPDPLTPERLAELRRAAEEAERWRQRYDDGSPAGLAPMSLDPATVLALVDLACEVHNSRAALEMLELEGNRQRDEIRETRAALARANAALVDADRFSAWNVAEARILWRSDHAAAIQAAREAQPDA